MPVAEFLLQHSAADAGLLVTRAEAMIGVNDLLGRRLFWGCGHLGFVCLQQSRWRLAFALDSDQAQLVMAEEEKGFKVR